jgi:glyoxalase family protein
MIVDKGHQGIFGIHHITAIASSPQKNIDFYTNFLGLRLVKLTVNFDDPQTYHLYYGDDIGRPGTILTFFPWQHVPKGFRGTGQVITTSFLIPENSIEYWIERLKTYRINYSGPTNRYDKEAVIKFYDPDGLELEFVAPKNTDLRRVHVWKKGPIPQEYATRGIYSATLLLEEYKQTASILTEIMGLSKTKREGDRIRFEIKDKEKIIDNNTLNSNDSLSLESSSKVDLLCIPNYQRGSIGVGTVHHIAWRTPNDESQINMRKKIIGVGLDATPVIDRRYFRSVYFREPGGILFEIATDPPGFTVDQKEEELGQKLLLPNWLEPDRRNLEKVLPKIKIPSIDTFSAGLNIGDKQTVNENE